MAQDIPPAILQTLDDYKETKEVSHREYISEELCSELSYKELDSIQSREIGWVVVRRYESNENIAPDEPSRMTSLYFNRTIGILDAQTLTINYNEAANFCSAFITRGSGL